MTDQPQEQQPDSESLAANVSGGVNANAERIDIGGDVVGRHKSTQNTWIRQFIMSPWAR